MSRPYVTAAALAAILVLVALADASSGGWSTVNWPVLGLLAVAAAVVVGVQVRRRP